MLPEDNELSKTTCAAKKLLYPLSMEVERIHACPNDCIIYRNEYSALDKCPKCGLSRYKQKENGVDGQSKQAAKVVWYLPIIPRFRRLFCNPSDAKLARWHAESKKFDGKLRHPVDSSE